MFGPYHTNKNRTISYRGNKIFRPIKNVLEFDVPIDEIKKRVESLKNNDMWFHLSKINHSINKSSNDFFDKQGALFVNLPLTTRMISSPGAVYGKYRLNYTTDTCPITLKWFNLPKKVFLSESSQIYLELALLQKNVDKVYSIYNSFRKEKADVTHLSEFHHIEFEGKIDQEENEKMVLRLIQKIIFDLFKNNKDDLSYFLDEIKLNELKKFAEDILKTPKITFKECLDLLYDETKDKKYKEFTLKNFGAWEEVKITEILGTMVIIKEFPLFEVPFYHAVVDGKQPLVADNADFIWSGYREIVGSGRRVRNIKELKEKVEIFNLSKKDYEPYLQSRKLKNYEETSGFGLGWERFLQGLLEMPFIWSVCHFPRVDKIMVP